MKRKYTGLFNCFLTLLLAFSMMFSGMDSMKFTYDVQAADTYDVEKALQYAREHWNDGQGLCAEFVSRCARAAGCNISVYGYAIDAFEAISRATGVQSQDVILNGDGYATQASNGDRLAAGDVVVQWCYTHGKQPHILLCGGYNSSGIATFYAHNSALNNVAYRLGRNTAYEHTTSCNMGAKVLHFGTNSPISIEENPGAPYPIPTRTLVKGSSGDDVRWVQKFANDVLGEGIAIDGIYGNDTEWQVLYFQRQHGLSDDGMAGSATVSAMLQAWREKVNQNKDTTPPSISNIKITQVDRTGYTVECDVADNVGVRNVAFPTWTTYNGQDELLWVDGTLSGNHAWYRVNIADHNNEAGEYITHIYAYDDAGNASSSNAGNIYILNGYQPENVEAYNNHIYLIFNGGDTWSSAKKKCEEMGGHLATITSQKENDFLTKLCKGGSLSYYRIGATDEETEGTWKWITGENFNYSNWANGEPNNSGDGEDYAWLSISGKWNDIGAGYGSNTGFILEIEDEFTPVKSTVYGNSEYELYNVTMPWEAAKVYCELHGGTLACITSEAENNAVKQLAKGSGKNYYYLGASDKEKEGTWKWVTGEAFSYANWTSGEPSNHSGDSVHGPENYLTLDNNMGGTWNDLKSQWTNAGFILEKPYTKELSVNLTLNGLKDNLTVEEGDRVTLSAGADGGSESYRYEFVVKNKASNSTYRFPSQSSGQLVWVASSAHDREFYVEVIDAAGKTAKSQVISVTVNKKSVPLSIKGTASASNITTGSGVTITGTASGGSGAYTYSILVRNKATNTWYRFSDFTASNKLTWTATGMGDREFYVEVKDSTGQVVRSSAIPVAVTAGVSADELKIAGIASASDITVGSKVTILGSASGGSGVYTYSMLVRNKTTNEWYRFSGFNSSNMLTWTATSVGDREFYIEVKDSSGKVVRSAAITVAVRAKEKTAELKVTGTSSASNITVGSKVTIAGTASGGSGTYTYSILVRNKATNEWYRFSGFNSSNSLTWTATGSGDREFYVEAKDSTGKVVRSQAVNVVIK